MDRKRYSKGLKAQIALNAIKGQKEFLAIEDGIRESTQSWRDVLLKLKSRGMDFTQLAIGDGPWGFGAHPRWNLSSDTSSAQLRTLNKKYPQLSLPKTTQHYAKQAIHNHL